MGGITQKAKVNNSFQTYFIISNYLYINETIIFIRFYHNKLPQNTATAIKFQDDYISQFIKLN